MRGLRGFEQICVNKYFVLSRFHQGWTATVILLDYIKAFNCLDDANLPHKLSTLELCRTVKVWITNVFCLAIYILSKLLSRKRYFQTQTQFISNLTRSHTRIEPRKWHFYTNYKWLSILHAKLKRYTYVCRWQYTLLVRPGADYFEIDRIRWLNQYNIYRIHSNCLATL